MRSGELGASRVGVRLVVVAGLLAAAVLAGCGDIVTPPATQLVRIQGDDQHGAVAGTGLPGPLFVRLLRSDGRGAGGVAVAWEVRSGDGVVEPGGDRTDADGYAWTIVRAGQRTGALTVVARAGGHEAFFTTSIRPAAPVRLSILDSSLSFDALGDTLAPRIVAEDAYGNPHPATSVGWSSVDTAVVTVADGAVVSRANGETRVVARLQGLVDTMAVRVRQEARAIAIVGGARLAPGDLARVHAVDGRGHPAPDVAVAFRSVPGIEEARTPIPSARGLTFRWLSASIGGHVCGLRSTGELYCWGATNWGPSGPALRWTGRSRSA
jgi:hypothetical protein